jgi:predicted ribosome quality control (RQC) complex YloA/Tae2 family protein
MPVPMDSFTITFLARELDRLLRGRQIGEVAIGPARTLAVAFEGKPAGELRLLYDPAFPLLFWDRAPRPERSREPAPRFAEPLRGAVVERVEQVGLERVVRLAAERPGGGHARLYFELTPPLPNLFLTDGRDTVEAILLRAGTQTRKRSVRQGEKYSAPAAQDRVDPLRIAADEIEALPWRTDPEALSRALSGMSPFFSRELAWRAAKRGSLAGAFREAVRVHTAGTLYASTFRVSEALAKRPPAIGVAWYRPEMEGVTDLKAAPSINAAVEIVFHVFMRSTALDRRRSSVLNALAKNAARWQAIAADAARAVAGGRGAADLRRRAELVLANLSLITKGMAEAPLPDIYSEEPGRIIVPLEQHLSPQANADAYFKQARRVERRAALAQETIRTARRRLMDLAALKGEAESRDVTPARLRQIEEELAPAAAPRTAKQEETDKRAAALGIRPRRFVIAGGWTLLVGRSAAENDLLTHKYAAASDLWFHARQAQGSHVVLKRDKRKTEPDHEAIIEAARIAAHYSKAKNSKHVPVSYTEKRYVRKVRGGAPGLAVMLREKVVFVTPAPPEP